MSGGPVSASRSTSVLCLDFQDFRVPINLIRFQMNFPFLHNILAFRNSKKTPILSHRFDNTISSCGSAEQDGATEQEVRPFGGTASNGDTWPRQPRSDLVPQRDRTQPWWFYSQDGAFQKLLEPPLALL